MPSSPGAAPRAATSSPSATNALSATPTKPDIAGKPGFGFPKSARILRSSEFRRVYDEGFRVSFQCFAAFCLHGAGEQGPRVGFTVSRALGKSVVRNRMKRLMREAVRLHLSELPAGWLVVFNPRKSILQASKEVIERDVTRVFSQCKNS